MSTGNPNRGLPGPLDVIPSDRLTSSNSLSDMEVVHEHGSYRILLPKGYWLEAEPGGSGQEVRVRDGATVYYVAAGFHPTSLEVRRIVKEVCEITDLGMDQRSLQLGLLNAFLQIKAGDGLLPTPISEIAASPSMHAELTGPRFVRGTATVTMGASKSFKTIDHVRQGLAQALGRPIGTARAGTREPFLHLLYEDPVHKISNIGAAILRGLNENLALPNNYYMKHMRGVPLADALLSLRKAHLAHGYVAVAVDTLGQARGESGDVHTNTNRYFAALSRWSDEIAFSTSDHIPRKAEESSQGSYHTLSTGRTEAIARRVLSQKIVGRGPGFIIVQYMVNLDNYGAAGRTWWERVSFTTKDFVNVDGSRTTVYDKISFEEATDFAAKAKLKQEDRALLFVLEVNEASTTEIAEHLGTSASNAGNVVSRLSEDGYLNKGHGNKKIPHALTREGQARARQLRSIQQSRGGSP